MLSVKFSNRAAKLIKRLEKKDKDRINQGINKLRLRPFPQDCVRVEGYKNYRVFRVRVGNYRILYSVFTNEDLILILTIDKRSRVYK